MVAPMKTLFSRSIRFMWYKLVIGCYTGLDAGKIMSIIHFETNGFSANYSHKYKMGDSQLILII